MHSRTKLAVALALGLAMGASVATAQSQDTRAGIAVLPFDNGGSYGEDAEVFDALQVGMQQMVMSELAQHANLRVVDRSQLRALIEEQDLGASGRVDAGTAARLGRLVGARYMVAGSFIDFYGDFRIDARIISVETGEIVNVAQVRDNRQELYRLVVDLGNAIIEDVNLPPLPADVRESRASREIPTDAMTLYSRALFYQDRGLTDRAIELFRRVESEFPQMTEATEALRQLGQS